MPASSPVETVELGHSEAAALGVAGIHAVEHGHPVAAFGAARARMQGEKGVVVIVFAAQEGADAHLFEVAFGGLQEGVELGDELLFSRLFDEVDDLVHLFERLFALVVGGDLALYRRDLSAQLCGKFEIAPHFRLFLLGFEGGKLLAQLVDVERLFGLLQRIGQRLRAHSVIVCSEHKHLAINLYDYTIKRKKLSIIVPCGGKHTQRRAEIFRAPFPLHIYFIVCCLAPVLCWLNPKGEELRRQMSQN